MNSVVGVLVGSSAHGAADMHPVPIVVGRNDWTGSDVTILPGVTIGDDAIVAAGDTLADL